MPRLRKTPVQQQQQQEKNSKQDTNQNTVTLTRTRRTPKPNPRYSSTEALTPLQLKQQESIKSRSNSPEIVKEEKHIPVLRKRGITPDSADYAKLAPKKRLIDRASTPKTEPTRKLPERVAKNVQSVQKPTNTQNVVTPAVKPRPTMVKMTRSTIIKKLDDEFLDGDDTDENKTDDTDDYKSVKATFTRSTRDSTRRSLNSLKPTNKVSIPSNPNRGKSDRIFIATSEDDNTEPDDEDMENINEEENKIVEIENKSKNGVKSFSMKNYGKKNDLNKAIENEATIVETVSKNNVPTFTIVNINDIINKKSNDDSMDSIDLTSSTTTETAQTSINENNNNLKNVINQATRGGRRKTVHKVLTDNIVNNTSNNNNNKPKQQQQRILNKTLGTNVVASSGNVKTANQINKPRILNAMLAKGLAEHKAATTTLKIVQTAAPDKQQSNQQVTTANGLKMYQQQQQQQQKTQNQLIRRDYHPKVQTGNYNNLVKQQPSTVVVSNKNNQNNVNIVRTYGRLNDKNTVNKQPITPNNNNNNKILNNNNKLPETSMSSNSVPTIITTRKIITSGTGATQQKLSSQLITNNLNKKNTIIRHNQQQQQPLKGTAVISTNTSANNNKLIKRLRKITCYETWYVINIPKYTIKTKTNNNTNNTLLMFGLVNLGNNIKEIKLPSSEWSYKIILEKCENNNSNTNISNNNDNSLLNEVYTGDLLINDDNKDNEANYKPFIIQFHRFLKEKTKNNNNNSNSDSDDNEQKNIDAGTVVVPVDNVTGEITNSTIVDTQTIAENMENNTKDEKNILLDDEKSIKISGNTESQNNLIEFYNNNTIKEFNIINYYKNNVKEYDRLLIFKNNQYYLLIDGNLCKLIGQPKQINNINDVEILLNIINDINIINSYICIENNNNNNKNNTDIDDEDDVTDTDDDDNDKL